MSVPQHAREADWLGACRTATADLARILAERPTTRERVEETGTRGEGGDRTLLIDRDAENAIFAGLDRLYEQGFRFTAISEERGEVDFGDAEIRVVIDPLDGSLNAKRGLPAHALSVAVADGPTMGDVFFGFVYDFGAGEEWVARRGQGVVLDGAPLPAPPGERRDEEGRLEVLAIESADPRWIAATCGELSDVAHRLRALGAIAVSLCQLAATRVDGFVTLWRTRAVDVAAAQLIARESGALVAFTAYDDPLGAPLDLEPHSPIVAARTPEALEQLRAVPAEAQVRR
jgi:myo-inositol-1(or 4)-monophosphatase